MNDELRELLTKQVMLLERIVQLLDADEERRVKNEEADAVFKQEMIEKFGIYPDSKKSADSNVCD